MATRSDLPCKVGDTVYIWHSIAKEMSKGEIKRILKLGNRDRDLRFDTDDFILGLDSFNVDWFTIGSLRQGYRQVTGLQNDNEFTDDEIAAYMTDILKED